MGFQPRPFGLAPVATAVASTTHVQRTPSNRIVGGFGDSRIFLSNSGGGFNDFLKGFGIAHWVQSYSGGACIMPSALNGGVAGDTTSQMLIRQPAYITTAKAAGCNLVVVMGSTNDRTGNALELAQSKQNLREIVRSFQINGIDVILVSETPRGNGSSSYELSTQAQRDDHYAMHVWIETEMSKICTVVNLWDQMVDPASGKLYYPRAETVRDGIHWSKIGAQLAGKGIGPAAARFTRGMPDLLLSNAAFSASNIRGTLTPNPLTIGTGGAISGNNNPAAGSQLAANWGAESSNMTGLTTTWSKEVVDGVEWQKVRITGTSGSTPPEITAFADVTLASLANGDKIKATGLVQSEGAGLGAVGLAMLMIPKYAQKLDVDDSDPSLPWPSERLGPLPYETPALVYQSADGHTLIRARVIINVRPSMAVDATVWFTKTGVFKVAYS